MPVTIAAMPVTIAAMPATIAAMPCGMVCAMSSNAEVSRRHLDAIRHAWEDFGDERRIADIVELSAMVSTNRVYRLVLNDSSAIIAKSSNYGSFFLFAEDHDR